MRSSMLINRFRRKDAARWLTERGLTTACSTLAKLAVTGGGPVIEYWGRIPTYPEDGLEAFAEKRLSRRVYSTSDRRVG